MKVKAFERKLEFVKGCVNTVSTTLRDSEKKEVDCDFTIEECKNILKCLVCLQYVLEDAEIYDFDDKLSII